MIIISISIYIPGLNEENAGGSSVTTIILRNMHSKTNSTHARTHTYIHNTSCIRLCLYLQYPMSFPQSFFPRCTHTHKHTPSTKHNNESKTHNCYKTKRRVRRSTQNHIIPASSFALRTASSFRCMNCTYTRA